MLQQEQLTTHGVSPRYGRSARYVADIKLAGLFSDPVPVHIAFKGGSDNAGYDIFQCEKNVINHTTYRACHYASVMQERHVSDSVNREAGKCNPCRNNCDAVPTGEVVKANQIIS